MPSASLLANPHLMCREGLPGTRIGCAQTRTRAANRNQGAWGRKSQWGPPPNWPVSAYDCVGEQCACSF